MVRSFSDTAPTPVTDIGTLRKRIKYRLGWPQIKLELTQDQMDEQILFSIKHFHKFAAGLGTEKHYMLFSLIPYQADYYLPAEINEVMDYDLDTSLTGINTLFTMENYMWFQGFLRFNEPFTLLSYHMVKDWLETMRKYIQGQFDFSYNRLLRRLHVTPVPIASDGTMVAFIEVAVKVDNEYLYDALWIEKYSVALCKEIIGRVRSKYTGASLPGIQATLDGEAMLQEAREDKEKLEKDLDLTDADGYPIIIG